MTTTMVAEPVLTLEKLMSMSENELDLLYIRSQAGPIPNGDSRGKASMVPGTLRGKVTEKFFGGVWKGKIFGHGEKDLVNKVLGMKMADAKVYKAKSQLDGREAIIIDYKHTAIPFPILTSVRDEIRQVGPELYLGIAYIGTYKWLFFALDFSGK
ncbi:MAG: hypothetical protein HY078_13795 [Elusimicrobia bacterium]|nr:hypothetical protein [Elusimicrobiota bacterium]